MTTLPLLLEYELRRPRNFTDKQLDRNRNERLRSALALIYPNTFQKYFYSFNEPSSSVKNIDFNTNNQKNRFQITLDVKHFTPEEFSIKITDGYIVIEGKHGEKKDKDGFISRQFTRRYALPKDCAPETVVSRLSSDRVLTVIATRRMTAVQEERLVRVVRIGPIRADGTNIIFGHKIQ